MILSLSNKALGRRRRAPGASASFISVFKIFYQLGQVLSKSAARQAHRYTGMRQVYELAIRTMER